MQGLEKRRYVRIPITRHVQLFFSSRRYDDCQLRNISLGGLYINGKFDQKVDEECVVNLTQTTQSTSLTFKADARVVRQDDGGVALEFTSMSFKSLLSLEMILLYEPREDGEENKIELPEDLPFKVTEEDAPLLDL